MHSKLDHHRRVDWDCVGRRVGLRFRGLVGRRDNAFSCGLVTAFPSIEIYGFVRTRGLSRQAVLGMTRVSGLTDGRFRKGKSLPA